MQRIPSHRIVIGLVAVSLGLGACSSSDPKTLTDAGSKALGSGDAKEAVELFDDALAHMNTQGGDFLRASMGRFQALARLDPTRTKNEFLAFQAAHTDQVKDADFKLVVDELLKRGSLTAATDIVAAAKQAYPESTVVVQLINALGDAARKANDPASVGKLKGLGYTGDG